MDIVTHAGIGLIAASPFLASRPELALGIVAGSVLPDLDAFSRLGNKRAFLRFHQTWSHALPVQAAVSAGIGVLTAGLGARGFELGGGLFAGLAGHSLLDLCNTFGVALFAPFSRRRFCLEWVFFIDAVVLAATALALVLIGPGWFRDGEVQGYYAAGFFCFLMAYVLAKGALRNRAGEFVSAARAQSDDAGAPDLSGSAPTQTHEPRGHSEFPKPDKSGVPAESLVPSALVPWRFYGTRSEGEIVEVFQINALTGTQRPLVRTKVFDADFGPTLEALPEFRSMQELSPAYHVIRAQAEGAEMCLLCRDMRMRNFGTRFGDLEVRLDANKHVLCTRFYV
jgi:membrane-bound metal-dependent hydrolase YbcI (DUF457 family)